MNFGANWTGGSATGWHQRPGDQHYHGRFSWQEDKVHALIRHLQPQVIVNDRTEMPADFLTHEG